MSELSIGDFSRATHLSVKTLRYYHEAGLLIPAEVDPRTGYRRYRVEQLAPAQIIRRFRDLDMPIERVRAVLGAPTLEDRQAVIADQVRDLEQELSRKHGAVAQLRDLLAGEIPELPVEHRQLAQRRALVISAEVASTAIGPWVQGALSELYGTATAGELEVTGAAGGEYAEGLFAEESGVARVFLPVATAIAATGRVTSEVLPARTLAVVSHRGPETTITRAYGALATYVARHELAIPGDILEFYPVNQHHTRDAHLWRTEIGWPILAPGVLTNPGAER